MWNVFRRLKSWSETNFTAAEAVVLWAPLMDQRQVGQMELNSDDLCQRRVRSVLKCLKGSSCDEVVDNGSRGDFEIVWEEEDFGGWESRCSCVYWKNQNSQWWGKKSGACDGVEQ